MFKVQKILVPTDFSTCSTQAVEHAAALAGALGATVHLLHVCADPHLGPLPDAAHGMEAVYDSWTKVLEARRAAAAEKLKAEIAAQAGSGVEFTFALADGHPAETTLETAQEGGYDLVVMGTHGHTGLKHVFLGSVAERIVRLSSVPVLTVRHHD